MAGPCFNEVRSPVFNYTAFEVVLKEIIADVGYPEKQVVRWEMTGQANLERAGGVEQFWESYPGERHKAAGPFFISNRLYFDTNQDQNAYEVWQNTRRFYVNDYQPEAVPTAIIAGTFELSTTWWYDRNILGRLLAVALGARNETLPKTMKDQDHEKMVLDQYQVFCDQLGYSQAICETNGGPIIPTPEYKKKWGDGWVVWKADICERMTTTEVTKAMRPRSSDRVATQANSYFWNVFGFPAHTHTRVGQHPTLPDDLQALQRHLIPHCGVMLDTTRSLVPADRLGTILTDTIAKLGFNIAQLRLVSNKGFTFTPSSLPHTVGHSLLATKEIKVYTRSDLMGTVAKASAVGIQMIPEISMTTGSAGWYESGYLANCPNRLCEIGDASIDVTNPFLPPTVYSLIYELRSIFSSSPYIHLGSDERQDAAACYQEANPTFHADVGAFERKMVKVLEASGIANDSVLRYANSQGEVYSDRTGGVTHYGPDHATEIPADAPIFVSVDLLRDDGWTLYQRVKELVSKKPLGILAEIRTLTAPRWEGLEIPERLLVYAMAVSELPTYANAAALGERYGELCRALSDRLPGLGRRHDCALPGVVSGKVTFLADTSTFVQQQCQMATYPVTQHHAKLVAPRYNATEWEQLRGAPRVFPAAGRDPQRHHPVVIGHGKSGDESPVESVAS
jgi:hypothetical protein